MTDATPAIEVRQLSRDFGDRTALRQITFAVAAGETLALTGPNGSGKTTLLRCLATELRPTSGEVRWFGTPAQARPAARRLIGMVAHQSRLYPHLSVRENLVFAARMCDAPRPQQRVDELLDDVGLQAHAAHRPPELSQGLRQRAAVARALIHDPRILFLDEPFSGLDAAAAAWLGDRLATLRGAGRTICVALHDVALVQRLADRVLELRAGRLQSLAPAAGRVNLSPPPAARAA